MAMHRRYFHIRLLIVLFLVITTQLPGQLIPGVVASSIKSSLVPTALWEFEEASGNAVDDINGNNATMTGVTYQQTGKIDYCYYFDGADYGIVGQPSVLNISPKDDPISIVVWFRSNAGSGYIISKGNSDGTTRQYNMYCDGTYLNCNMSGGTWTDFTGVNISNNAWHLLVVTSPGDGNAGHAYIDGSLQGNTIPMGTAAANSVDITIGCRRDTGNTGQAALLTGNIDRLRIYNVELTQTQITTIYDAEN